MIEVRVLDVSGRAVCDCEQFFYRSFAAMSPMSDDGEPVREGLLHRFGFAFAGQLSEIFGQSFGFRIANIQSHCSSYDENHVHIYIVDQCI